MVNATMGCRLAPPICLLHKELAEMMTAGSLLLSSGIPRFSGEGEILIRFRVVVTVEDRIVDEISVVNAAVLRDVQVGVGRSVMFTPL